MGLNDIVEAVVKAINVGWNLVDKTKVDAVSHSFKDDNDRYVSVKVSRGESKDGEKSDLKGK